MSDNWNFYIDKLDEHIASFVVDLDVTEANIKKYKCIEEEEPWAFYYEFLYPNEYHF
jgi:hypothetical protein